MIMIAKNVYLDSFTIEKKITCRDIITNRHALILYFHLALVQLKLAIMDKI